MNVLKEQLKAISDTLSVLSRQVERISRYVERLQPVSAPSGEETISMEEEARGEKPIRQSTVLESVYDAIRRSRNGASINKIREKTGLEARQLSNALYKLAKRGKIEARARGVYVKK